MTDWEAAVCKHRGLPARAGMIALWLARRMNQNRIVSVSEAAIMEAFGLAPSSRDTVIRSIKRLRDEGLLTSVVVGRKGMTAVYQGMFPVVAAEPVAAGDAPREALARMSRGSAKRPRTVVAEKYVHDPRNVVAMDDVSDHEPWSPRTGEQLDKASDSPWSGQEHAGDDDEEFPWIDEVFSGRDPDEDPTPPATRKKKPSRTDAAFSLQGAKRPAPPEAPEIVSPLVKAALEDWSGTSQGQQGVDVKVKQKRSGGRAA